MHRIIGTVLLLALTSTLVSAQTVVIRAGHLVDVVNGRLIDNQSILVEDGRIAAVGSRVVAPDGTPVVDLSGSYVMPGLIERNRGALWR